MFLIINMFFKNLVFIISIYYQLLSFSREKINYLRVMDEVVYIVTPISLNHQLESGIYKCFIKHTATKISSIT